MGKSFEKMFRAMQYLNLCTLYYDFDFDKEQLKQFNANVTDYNNSSLTTENFYTELARIYNQYGFDCKKAIFEFPFRAKLKILEVKPGGRYITDNLKESNNAMQICLVLFIRELITSWGKSAGDIQLYWSKMKEYSLNYANGMTNEFVQQYFIEQIDLAITE